MRHIGLFKELGFSEHETKIYTCMLQQGGITASDLLPALKGRGFPS